MEEKEEERKRRVAEKRAEMARRRLKEVQLDDYQPQEWESKEQMEQVSAFVEHSCFVLLQVSAFGLYLRVPRGSMDHALFH